MFQIRIISQQKNKKLLTHLHARPHCFHALAPLLLHNSLYLSTGLSVYPICLSILLCLSTYLAAIYLASNLARSVYLSVCLPRSTGLSLGRQADVNLSPVQRAPRVFLALAVGSPVRSESSPNLQYLRSDASTGAYIRLVYLFLIRMPVLASFEFLSLLFPPMAEEKKGVQERLFCLCGRLTSVGGEEEDRDADPQMQWRYFSDDYVTSSSTFNPDPRGVYLLLFRRISPLHSSKKASKTDRESKREREMSAGLARVSQQRRVAVRYLSVSFLFLRFFLDLSRFSPVLG